MIQQTNPSISVDCVVFGFDGASLKVLLIKRDFINEAGEQVTDYKLPGSLIFENEDLNSSANRTLEEYTGNRDIYLRQLHVFSQPDRVRGDELSWLNAHYGVNTSRVVTVAYYSLVKLGLKLISYSENKGARWVDIESVHHLAMDHKDILVYALHMLNKQFMAEPIAFELLPRKFTLKQLQLLYEAILGVDIDNRNFRKKVLSSGYIQATDEKEKNVAHKPAIFYTFNKNKFVKDTKQKFRLNFINWQL